MANTVCELFNFGRPSGRLKTLECRQFLEYLETKGVIELPDRKKGRPKGVKTNVGRTDRGGAQEIISRKVRESCVIHKILRFQLAADKMSIFFYNDIPPCK